VKGTFKFLASLYALCIWALPQQSFGQDEAEFPCSGLPYNIDVDCNGFINFTDLTAFLPYWGENFTPDLDSLDIDLSNELQFLLLENDTLYLMLADSTTVYSQVYLGCAACEDGLNGLSAYELWLEAGNVGSLADFLNSLVGEAGADGIQGPEGPEGPAGADGADGADGANGADGADGEDGLSAYEIWLAAGNSGTEDDFLDSLIGANGADGADGENGSDGAEGPAGPAGADGAPGLSAYETWLSIGNVGTEEDFIAFLAAGGDNSPSVHGVFDSDVDGFTFEVTNAVSTLSIEVWGTSGGTGGDVCGQTSGATSCNLCNATGGQGGRALKVISMIYNVAAGDVLELISADAGADSEELITCTPGPFGWTNWDCGPASSGTDGGITQLLLNGELITEISGGTGGIGGCIGCQGDGCFNGDAGSNGSLTSNADWVTILNTEPLPEDTGSRLVIRY